MENIMTTNDFPHGLKRLGRTLGLGMGLGLALLANLGDRAFSASAANSGIDPLQILDTAVKNNILFFVDTSGSMAGTPEDQNFVVGGDDPASRFYQMKRAVREVIAANVGKANFGLATFDPDAREAEMQGADGLIYLTQDPTGAGWFGYFNAVNQTLTNINVDTCTGVGGVCTAAEKPKVFRGLDSTNLNSAYPAVCTPQAGSQVSTTGVINPPITHTYGTHCRYYLNSMLMRNGKRYVVTPGITNATTRRNTSVVSSANIVCPPPPPGLLGDDVLPFANGSKPRACFQIQNATTSAITTYWATSGHFQYVDNAAAPGTDSCNSNGTVIGVSPCDSDQSAAIQANMRMELQYDAATGNAQFLPPLTSLVAAKPGITDTPYPLPNPPVRFNNVGIRQAFFTPLQAAMDFSLAYFQNTVLTPSGTPQRPVAAIGKQKQFVILLTDGDETCGGDPVTAAFRLWSNTAPALPACTGACLTSKGLTAGQWATANRIELLMITFAGGTPATVNAISQAGSGKNGATCTPLYPTIPGSPLSPCRNSFIATNLTDLVNALNAAINTSTATGEFSDQQSVTETVFEFASVGTPPKDPLDPEDRYAVSVPILMQSTFELPGWVGHLNAFRRSDNGTPANLADDISVQAWDAGQLLKDRVTNATNGMGTALYYFTDLYGNANTTPPLGVMTTATNNVKSSTAKIKRRIFTTTQNGVNPNYNVNNLLNPAGNAVALAWTRVPLWPPTVSTTANTSVAPAETAAGAAEVRGVLDTAMGFDALTTVAQVQAAVPGACQGTVAANIHPKCTSATAAIALSRAKFEARQIVLAYLAGAQVDAQNGLPVRTGTTGPAAGRQQLQFSVRPWVLAESTLAAPGVVTPPLLAGPKTAPGAVGVDEYKDYRDGLRTSSGAAVNGVINGIGLRNPDRLDPANTAIPQSLRDAAAADLTLKPSMSVVYHATNQGLHAFRAGPCPPPPAGFGLGAPVADCGVSLEDPTRRELGGEELWAFVPFDVLFKLPALTRVQDRGNKQYLLASPVRFADVFVPGSGTFGGKGFAGVWRTMLYFGRGQGGTYYTALDITAPGPFTRLSLNTELPPFVWSRGNPDTTSGVTTALGGTRNNTAADYDAYLGMGETWSLPSVGFVSAANFTTPRTGVNGTNFVLFTGSGYSDVTTPVATHPLGEGKTFYVLDALNGDVVRSFDIPNGTPAPLPPPNTVLTNFLVAPPVVYAEDELGNSPSGYRFIGNPIAARAKTVYFGDLHSRIWRYDVTTPATPPSVFFQAATATDGNQPFATAVSVLQNRPNTAVPGDVLVYAETGHDRRVPTPSEGNRPAVPGAPPFKAYAITDPMSGSPGTLQFTRNFETNYRGTVQPASAFAGPVPPAPVVFYAGTKFTASQCIGTFDSILIALKGVVATPGAAPDAAFDLKATGDDAFIEFTGKKVNAIRVSGEGSLVVDQGLNAENPPPPPGVPVASETISSSSSLVTLGLVPGTTLYTRLAPTTANYRIGSSVCRTEN